MPPPPRKTPPRGKTAQGMREVLRAEDRALADLTKAARRQVRAGAGKLPYVKAKRAMASELESSILQIRLAGIEKANAISATEFGGAPYAVTSDEQKRARSVAQSFAGEWARRVAAGTSPTQALKNLQGRLDTIAVTENQHAYAEARSESLRTIGRVVLEWCAYLDKRTCSRCRKLDGKRVTVRAGKRPVWPGGLTPGAAHPRCRCYTQVVEREKAKPVKKAPKRAKPASPSTELGLGGHMSFAVAPKKKRPAAKKLAAKKTTKRVAKKTAAKRVAKKSAAKRTLRKVTARKTAARKVTARKKTAAAKKATARKKASSKKTSAKRTAKRTARAKTTSRKVASRKVASKRASSRKVASKKLAAKRAAKKTAKKVSSRKVASKRTPARRAAAKKTVAKRTAKKPSVRKPRAKVASPPAPPPPAPPAYSESSKAIGIKAAPKTYRRTVGARNVDAVSRAFVQRGEVRHVNATDLVFRRSNVPTAAIRAGKLSQEVRAIKVGRRYVVLAGDEGHAMRQAKVAGNVTVRFVRAPKPPPPTKIAKRRDQAKALHKGLKTGTARQAARDVLKSHGIESRDWHEMAPKADVLETKDSLQYLVNKKSGTGVKGAHYHLEDEVNGGQVLLRSDTAKSARIAVRKIAAGKTPTDRQVRGLGAVLHEEIHGASPHAAAVNGDPVGTRFEEACTEVLARRVTRKMLRVPSGMTGKSYDLPSYGTSNGEAKYEDRAYERSVSMVFRSTRARGLSDEDVEKAILHMRSKASLHEVHSTSSDAIRGLGSRLGLSGDDLEAFDDEITSGMEHFASIGLS